MDNKVINNIINEYETKLKKRDENFKLTEFEKILMKEAIEYGYEFCLNELKLNKRYKK